MARNRQDLIRSAERLVGRGKLRAAVGEYRKVLNKFPDDTSVLNRVGDLYARLDRLDDAIGLFRRAASHFARQGFFVKAIAIYKKIIRLDPTQIGAYERLADLYHRQGLISEARAQFGVVADYYLKHQQLDSAIDIHRRIIELEPEDPSPRLRLAELCRRHRRKDAALEQYRAIAAQMLEHDRVDDAKRVFLRAVETSGGDLDFITGVLQQLKDGGHREAARELLQVAVEQNPEVAKLGGRLGLSGPSVSELFSEPEAAEEPEAVPAEAPIAEPEPAELSAANETADDALTLLDLDADGLAAEIEAAREEALGRVTEGGAAGTEPPPAEIELEEFEIDLADLEAEAAPEPASEAEEEKEPSGIEERLAELMAEADVLARYGLEEKAIERLDELLAEAPDRVEAYRRLIPLEMEKGNAERVVYLANQFAEVAARAGATELWERARDYLMAEGFKFTGDRFVSAGKPVSPEPAAEEIPEEEPVSGPVDLSWLEEEGEGAEAARTPDSLFREEEDFFDLASELEEELRSEPAVEETDMVSLAEEQSLEEIVEGFKRGMAETVSPEDFDTHYNLGIAYREMGLLDEAIGEFQLAAKDPRYLVDCCSLLAACFVDKGFPELAVKWYRQGLQSPSISEDESLGLIYELGDLYLTLGDEQAARERFVEIYGIKSNYRDVVARLEELDRM